MRKLRVHEEGKDCNCLFCLTQCPKCGASFSLGFSASYDMVKSEEMILFHGSVTAMAVETDLLDHHPDHHPNLACPECGTGLTETHVVKLKKALFSAIGGNVRIDRKEEGAIEIGRFVVKRKPVPKRARKKEGE